MRVHSSSTPLPLVSPRSVVTTSVTSGSEAIVSGARAGRQFATATARTTEPVLQSADNASTPKGLATGVSVALGHSKERAQLQAEIASLKRRLAARKTDADALLSTKNKCITKQAAELRETQAALSQARQELFSRRNQSFDNGFKLGSQSQPSPEQLRPVQPAGKLVPVTPASTVPVGLVPDIWYHINQGVHLVQRFADAHAKSARSTDSVRNHPRGNCAGKKLQARKANALAPAPEVPTTAKQPNTA